MQVTAESKPVSKCGLIRPLNSCNPVTVSALGEEMASHIPHEERMVLRLLFFQKKKGIFFSFATVEVLFKTFLQL